jgi:CIC family chloride channel protein
VESTPTDTRGGLVVFHRSLVEFLGDLPRSARWFWVLVVVTGVLAGLGAVALLYLLLAVQRLAWPPGPTFQTAVMAAPPWHRVLAPSLAGLMVGVASMIARRPLGGHGTAGIIEAIWLRAGKLPLGRTLVRGALSIVAVGLGASLGREGALIQIGSAAASGMADAAKVSASRARLLVACGAAAGIAAAYNVPIGGALFSLEVLLGSFALDLFGPIVVSSVVATLISRALVSSHPSYEIPHYALRSPIDLARALAIGPVLGVFAALYIWVIDGTAAIFDKVPRRLSSLMPPLGLFAVGLTAIWFPQVLGNGYDTVNAALQSGLTLRLLLVLPMLKMVATAVCAGSGVPGGLFTPSLFYGGLLGAAYGWLTQGLGGHVSPGAFALLGMGAMLAGTTHASVSSVLIIFELTGDYGLILPLMLCCVAAAAVSRRLSPDSLYSSALRRHNVVVPAMPQPQWMRGRRVRELVSPRADRVGAATPIRRVVLILLDLPKGHDLYVTGGDGRLLGVIDLDGLARVPPENRPQLSIASDVMDPSVPAVPIDATVSEAAITFQDTELERLPVVAPGKILVGTVAKREVLRHGAF